MRYTHAHSHVVVRCRSLKSSQIAKVEMSETRKRRSTGNVTLADVAKQAGVGTMTVSRALRTPDLVSEKLREKIQQVVDELGYIPNKAAGALASAESYSIALILPSLVEKSCAHFCQTFSTRSIKRAISFCLATVVIRLSRKKNCSVLFGRSSCRCGSFW